MRMAPTDNLGLEEATPSKPRQSRAESLVSSPESLHSDHDADRTIMPAVQGSRRANSPVRRANTSSRRADPNATFLTECSFGVAHDKLVQVITDVYGSEPYWEHLKSVDLRGKGVESVARLEEFLPEIEEVVLYVPQPHGIPRSSTETTTSCPTSPASPTPRLPCTSATTVSPACPASTTCATSVSWTFPTTSWTA